MKSATFTVTAVASSPAQLKERAVEEAACPGNQYALARVSDFPRQFTLENYRSAASFAAIIVRQASEGPTYSVNPLCGKLLQAATEKHFALVQKLWRIRVACGSLRKTKEEPREDGSEL